MDRDLYDYLREQVNISSMASLCKSIDEIGPYMSGFAVTNRMTMAKLMHYKPAANRKRYYRQFHIPKKSGGVRTITAPDGQLKDLMFTLNFIFSTLYQPTNAAMAFLPNRSVKTNASRHIGRNYVLNLDLKDFFTSITSHDVEHGLMTLGIGQDIARLLSLICTYPEKTETAKYHNVVPQGAPTSPVLSNICSVTLDKRLEGLARRFHLTYTRYADDMTFSSNHNVYQPDGDFMTELYNIIRECGFLVNPKKTRLQKRGVRQEVTGITVEKHANVSRKYVKNLRALIHHISLQDNPGEHDVNVARGKLNYMRMIKGANDSTYIGLCVKLNKAIANKHFVST